MDMTLNRDALADSLSEVITIASRKTAIPALSSVLVDARAQRVTLSATDLEIGARVGCNAQVKTLGRALLPAKRLHDIVRLLPPDASVRVTATDATATVECGQYVTRMQTFAANDFPVFPEAPKASAPAQIPGATLATLIRKVSYATLPSGDARYFLAGACMVLEPETIRFVATDGHRLAIASAPRRKGPEAKVLISAQALSELAPMFESVDDPVSFTVEANRMRFSAGDRLLLATIIDGQFPAFERVIPKGHDKVLAVDRDELATALRRVMLATNEGARAVAFSVDGNVLNLSAASQENGEAMETVRVDYKGEPVSVRVSGPYAIHFLDAAEGGRIMVEMKDDRSPVVFRQADDIAVDYRGVIMPVAL